MFGIAIILLLFSAVGIFLLARQMRTKECNTGYKIATICLAVIAAILLGYLATTLFFLDSIP